MKYKSSQHIKLNMTQKYVIWSEIMNIHNGANNTIFKKVRLKINSLHPGIIQVFQNLTILVLIMFFQGVNGNRPPRFAIDGQSEIVLHLRESPETKVGSLIYVLRGFDPDNDTLTFGKRISGDSDIIQIENTAQNEANVYLAQELDRETKDEYSIILTLTDNQYNDFNFVTQSFLILVEDINDNAPIFMPYQNTIEIPENSKPAVISTLVATDADEGAYGQVVYYLREIDGDHDMFAISTTEGRGILSLVGALDYETKSLYQLRILAIDRANQGPVNTGTAAILIKVSDVADQPPEFVAVQPVARIVENVPIGTEVLHIHAIDGDHGINNPIAYEVQSNELFDIDRESGIVFTINELDREDPSNQVNGAYILNVIAYEISKNQTSLTDQNSVRTEVTIIVTDINDEIPMFGEAIYRCEINENAQINTPLNFLGDDVHNYVFDHDVGKNGTFRLFLDPQNDLFEIVPNLAVNEANFMLRVKNSKSLDFEILNEINFTIFARELDEPTRWSSAHVQIYIRDQNDNFPEFTKNIYNVSIPENPEHGTVIIQIQAYDSDSGEYGTMGLRYKNLRGGIAHLLHLHPVTGALTINKSGVDAFDREIISRHYLTVEAIDNLGMGNRNTAQIIINIEDVNDNAPIFIQRQYATKLLENKRNFETTLILEARDIDLAGTENSEITYEIVEGLYRNNFSIDPAKGLLRPLHAFDYEQLTENKRSTHNLMNSMQQLELLVRARDSGIPMLSTVVPVLIYVEDVNDNAPIFQMSFYTKIIPEDYAAGSSILQVNALDRDGSTPNNAVVYRIQKGASDKFVINSETGVISVAKGANLDPDLTDNSRNLYSLTVLALDGGIGQSQLSGMTTVNISIKDVNNKLPIFEDMPFLHVLENRKIGTVVYRVQAHDLDELPILRYKINWNKTEVRNEETALVKLSEYDFANTFELDAVDGTLKLVKLLDREKFEFIKLSISVEDLAASNNRQIVETFLNIHVDDENDNNPRFLQPYYRKSITENSMNGAIITNVLAYDVDKNRTITYSLEANVIIKNLIYLDRHTGEILVANRIDHEQIQWLNFTVRATDSGWPQRSSYVDVYVTVLDENDNNPYFVGGSKNYTISENCVLGTRIGVVQAADADSGDFGKITYLMDRISSQGKFAIDADTGVLTVVERLDREIKDAYMLVIEAWDNYQFGFQEGQSRNAFKQIFITIQDENDNVPEVSFPTNPVLITEYQDINERVALIQGKDDDDPNTANGRLIFKISRTSDEGLFELRQIDAWNAEIYAAYSLRNKFGNYTLEITTRDLGAPSNVVSKTLNIYVADFNDHAPVFVVPLYNTTIRLAENTTLGTVIMEVFATDADIGINALVHYRLKPDPLGSYKMFHLDVETGHLTLQRKLNRTKQKLHELRIEAYDQGLPTSLSTDMDLTIYVRNVNEYEPQFVIEEITVNFTEHVEPGVERIKLPDTIDKDEVNDLDDPPSQICYFIAKGNEDHYFKLDADTHILTVQRELDREINANFTLFVKATANCALAHEMNFNVQNTLHSANSSNQALSNNFTQHVNDNNIDKFFIKDSTFLRLVVLVIDINDNPPRFKSKIFTGGITTNADFGTKFMRVEASDADDGDNAQISYYQVGEIRQTLSEGLENVPKDPFLVDVSTGEVQLNFDPQKSMKGYFDFMVVANDTAGMHDVAHVFIYLLREDQKVRFVFRLQPNELRERIHLFRETLSRITDSIVNIDEIKVHVNKDGSVDKTKTDLYLHLVDKDDNSIYDVSEVLHLIDAEINNLNTLFKELNVLDTQPAAAELVMAHPANAPIMVWLVFTNLFLATLLIATMSLCAAQRKDFKRQLRAAKINIFQHSSLSLVDNIEGITRVPNTNKHCLQGSNPIWLKGCENEWYKTDDNLSFEAAAGHDSIDDNFIGLGAQDLNETLKGTAKLFNQTNDLNRHFNVYNQIDKLANSAQILAKRLETTEL